MTRTPCVCLGKRRQKTAAPTDVSFAPTFQPARSGWPSETGGGPSSDGMQHSATFSAGPSTRNLQTLPFLLFFSSLRKFGNKQCVTIYLKLFHDALMLVV